MSKHLEMPRTPPGMHESLDQLYELSGSRKPEIMAKIFAPKPTFAPGPWQVMNDYNGATIVIANVDGETFSDGSSTFSYDFVCDTLPDDGDGSRSSEIAKANARLIAAAPDQHEALRRTRAWLKHWQDDVAHGLMPTAESLQDALAVVEAALAKGGA